MGSKQANKNVKSPTQAEETIPDRRLRMSAGLKGGKELVY